MKIVSFFTLLLFCSVNLCAQQPSARLTDARTERKIDSLLRLMTLEEKVGQLNQYTSSWELTGPLPTDNDNQKKLDQLRTGQIGSMLNVIGADATRKAQELALQSRLKIPLIFGYDVIHGHKTMFPVPLGESASWDLDIVEKGARVAAIESSAAGIHWTFAPMMDISRDPRWGRVMEGSGEDTYLGAKLAAARVRGFQGTDLAANNTIAACAKHFAGYGLSEAGRDYNTVDMSENTLRNIILPPFQAAVDAGVATVMNSFNEIGGIPATADPHLQRDILKGEWNFDGFVVSDWGSIGELIPHGVAKDNNDAARLAITAGSDMDMEARAYIGELAKLVKNGVVSEQILNEAVRRVLRVKYKLGLFDDPFRYSNAEREKNSIYTKEHLAIARESGKKSIVLLKNEKNLLPLIKNIKSIAVIGSLANDKDTPLGNWRAQAVANSAVSLLEGIKAKVGATTKVTYAEGYKLAIGERIFAKDLVFETQDRSGFKAAIDAAKTVEVVVMAIGEDCYQTGEGRSHADLTLKGLQEELLKEIYKVNKNIVVVLMNGRPLLINWEAENVPAIVEAWHLGSEAGNSIADVLFGDYNPSGKLPITFPKNMGQIPLYYNRKSTGRPYAPGVVFWSHYSDSENTPLYPFGFGLSYSTFSFSDISLSSKVMGQSSPIQVTVTVTNTSKVAGTEVVQLYVRDMVGSVTRPIKELKGFEKIMLQPGESRKVTFTLSTKDLAFYSAAKKWEAEPGDFKVMVGPNSDNLKEASFELK
jgi:beta-glucosidase